LFILLVRCLNSETAAIITKINVTPINDETKVIMVPIAINQTLTAAINDPTQRRIETFVSSRTMRP
jgi:hypothetical protein